MKRNAFFRTAVAAVMLLGITIASAHDFEVDGIYYNFNPYGNGVTVTYKGDSYQSSVDEYIGSIIIPSSVTHDEKVYNVTSIGVLAFYGCRGLISIEIPASVVSIESGAFMNCIGLINVQLSNSLKTIGESAFCNCGINEISLPNSLNYIGESAFFACTSLKSVIIPSSISVISSDLFSQCTNLNYIEIPNSVTKIGYGAFQECSALRYINIPNSVTTIECDAFFMSGLVTITIPENVSEISSAAFYGCTGLRSIYLPETITTIGYQAFNGCTSLISINIPNSVTTIESYAFENCSSLKSVLIPENVVKIGKNAFSGCSRLTVFYNAKKCIYGPTDGNYSVFNKSNSITFIIGEEVEQIGNYILNTSSGSTSRIISKSNTPPLLAGNTFDTNLCKLYVPNGSYAKYWSSNVWSEFANIVEITNPVTKIELSSEFERVGTNGSLKLLTTIYPSDATLKDVLWTSKNAEIATVANNGTVKGWQIGETEITVEAIDGSGVKATCGIIVEDIIAETLTLNPSELTLAINQSAKIMPVITPENVSNKTFEWSTSNAGVAPFKANSDGSITVLGAADGVATITCHTTDGSDLTATCTVTVGTGAVDGIEADAVTVRAVNGVIRVEGAEGARVEVYTTAGVCIYSGTDTEIYVPQRGLYVVKVAGRATKLAL